MSRFIVETEDVAMLGQSMAASGGFEEIAAAIEAVPRLSRPRFTADAGDELLLRLVDRCHRLAAGVNAAAVLTGLAAGLYDQTEQVVASGFVAQGPER